MPIEWDLQKRVLIRNLGETPTKNEIKSLFGKYGRICKLWVARNPPGFAFLEYENRSSAKEAARHLDGNRCCGSYIKVDLSQESLESRNRRTSVRTYDDRRPTRTKDIEVSKASRRAHQCQSNSCMSSYSHKKSSTSSRRRRGSERHLANKRSRSRTDGGQRLDCSICFGNILNRRPTITPCRHVFCASCIKIAIHQKETCPICQSALQEKQLQPIYLNP